MNRSSLLLMLALLNFLGVLTWSALTTSMALTMLLVDQAIPWRTTPEHPKPVLGLLSWGTKTSTPGSDTGTPHESAGFFSQLDDPMPPVGIQFPSSSNVSHLFHISWGNRLTSYLSPSSSGNH